MARSQNGTPPELSEITVGEEEYEEYLRLAYRSGEFEKPKDASGIPVVLPPEEMKALLVADIDITDEDLENLARLRAEQVKEYIEGQEELEKERVMIAPPGDGAHSLRVEMEMK
jgi:hypothetical protein